MDGPKQAHMDVLVAVPGRLTPAAVLAPKFKAKKTTKTKVVASNFVVYSDSVRRNPAANGVYRGMIAKSGVSYSANITSTVHEASSTS